MAASGRGRCAGGRPGLSGRVGSGRRARRPWAGGDVGVRTAGRARGRRAGGRDGQGPWPGPGGGGGSDWLFVSARSKMAAAGAEGRAGRAGGRGSRGRRAPGTPTPLMESPPPPPAGTRRPGRVRPGAGGRGREAAWASAPLLPGGRETRSSAHRAGRALACPSAGRLGPPEIRRLAP